MTNNFASLQFCRANLAKVTAQTTDIGDVIVSLEMDSSYISLSADNNEALLATLDRMRAAVLAATPLKEVA